RDAGRRLGRGGVDGAHGRLAVEDRLDVGRPDRPAPLDVEMNRFHAEGGADFAPSFPELAAADDKRLVATGKEIRDRSFHAGGAPAGSDPYRPPAVKYP